MYYKTILKSVIFLLNIVLIMVFPGIIFAQANLENDFSKAEKYFTTKDNSKIYLSLALKGFNKIYPKLNENPLLKIKTEYYLFMSYHEKIANSFVKSIDGSGGSFQPAFIDTAGSYLNIVMENLAAADSTTKWAVYKLNDTQTSDAVAFLDYEFIQEWPDEIKQKYAAYGIGLLKFYMYVGSDFGAEVMRTANKYITPTLSRLPIPDSLRETWNTIRKTYIKVETGTN